MDLGAVTKEVYSKVKDEVSGRYQEILAAGAYYNSELVDLNKVLGMFKESNILKSGLFLTIYPENRFGYENQGMFLTGFSYPSGVGIEHEVSVQHFYHAIPRIAQSNSVKIRFLLTSYNYMDTVYMRAYNSQFNEDGLLKVGKTKYDARIGYFTFGKPSSVGPEHMEYLTLKDIRLSYPIPSELDNRSNDFVEWLGTIVYDDYNVIRNED